MICQRCGLEGAIDIDTGSRCHAELGECIALLRADRERKDDHIKDAPCLVCGEASYPCDEPRCWKREALEGE